MLKRQKQLQQFLLKVASPVAAPARKRAPAKRRPPPGRLREVTGFGSNPGSLTMLEYVPPRLAANAPLVVVLHGCLQTAQRFDDGSGWSALARERRFAVLYPEQKSSNNHNLCFNWFRPSAVARDRGELMSVRQMIDSAVARHKIDPSRIYVVGLSAGAALASALLATYPERFAGAAIVGGLPFGAARDAMTALSVMNAGVRRSAAEWGDLVRAVSPEIVPPPVSIWHGTDDRVVSIANAEASLQQWLDVHGLSEEDGRESVQPWGVLRRWYDGRNRLVISFYRIAGMGHGLPLRRTPGAPDADRFMLNAGLSAPAELAGLWGLKRAR